MYERKEYKWPWAALDKSPRPLALYGVVTILSSVALGSWVIMKRWKHPWRSDDPRWLIQLRGLYTHWMLNYQVWRLRRLYGNISSAQNRSSSGDVSGRWRQYIASRAAMLTRLGVDGTEGDSGISMGSGK